MVGQCAPSLWPAHIIDRAVCYAIATDGQDDLAHQTQRPVGHAWCLESSRAGRYMGVCRNWANVIRIFHQRHLCIRIESSGSIAVSGSGAAPRPCSYYSISHMDSWRFVQRVAIEVSLEAVLAGQISKQKLCNGQLAQCPNARHLDIRVVPSGHYEARTLSYDLSMQPEAASSFAGGISELKGFVKHLVPNLGTIAVDCASNSQPAAAVAMGRVYQAIRDLVPSTDPGHAAGKGATYWALSPAINASALPPVAGLTSITLNVVKENDTSAMGVLTCSAATLQKVDVTMYVSLLARAMFSRESGQAVRYPQLTWLRMAVFVAVPVEGRGVCPIDNPFPRLRHLLLPGAYPFSDDELLRDRNGTLETLCLGTSTCELNPLDTFGLPHRKYPSLKAVEVRRLPLCRLPMAPVLAPSGAKVADSVAAEAAILAVALGTGPRQVTLDLGGSEAVSRFPLVGPLREAIAYTAGIHTLRLPSHVLDLAEVAELCAMLACLRVLAYHANADDPALHASTAAGLPGHRPADDAARAGRMELLEVGWPAGRLDEHAAQDVECAAAYARLLGTLLAPAGQVTLVTSSNQVRADDFNSALRRPVVGDDVAVGGTGRAGVCVDAATLTYKRPLPDLFALCQPA